jgi:hypothetical protein
MNADERNGHEDEATWIKRYMELMGSSESQARSAFMYLGQDEQRDVEQTRAQAEAPRNGSARDFETEAEP